MKFKSRQVFPEGIERCSPRGYIPRVCFVKHVNSLLKNVVVSLLIQFSPGERLREPLMISG